MATGSRAKQEHFHFPKSRRVYYCYLALGLCVASGSVAILQLLAWPLPFVQVWIWLRNNAMSRSERVAPPQLGPHRRVFVTNTTAMTGAAILERAFANRIIVSERSKLIYCPIPKAASSNWKYLLRKFEGLSDYDDLSKAHDPSLSGLRYLSDYSPDEVESLLRDQTYLKFTFVRDPYTRALSCYMDKFQNREEKYVEQEYQPFLAQLLDWRIARSIDATRTPRLSFPAFVDELAKQNPMEMNEHWMPQALLCGFGEMPYDFVGSMRTLQADSEFVLRSRNMSLERFPTQSDIGFKASGASDPENHGLYTLETMMKVRLIYDVDFNGRGDEWW